MTSKLPGGVASAIVGPRNLEAVGYLKQKEAAQSWVNRLDEVKEVSLVSDFLGDFVRGSTSHQYYAATLATEGGLTELRRVVNNLPKGQVLECYYDTTFEFGNYYVSIFSYRHPFLQRIVKNSYSRSDKPIVPVFIMIHQKKLIASHEFMLKTAEDSFDRKFTHARKTFANTPKVLVSDKEFDGEQLLSNCKTIHCWNHLKQNVANEATYKKHLREKDIQKVKDDFDEILLSTCPESYTERRDSFLKKKHWKDTGMADYYMKKVDQDFQKNSARWVLDHYGIGFGQHGITNNPAETVNSVIHSIKDKDQLIKLHKHFTVPDTMFFFHNYAQCNDKELQSAYFGTTSDFQVRPEYKKKFEKELTLMPPVYIQTVEEMKNELRERLDPAHDPMETETPIKIKPPKKDSDTEAFKKIAEYHVNQNRVEKVPHLRSFFAVRDLATDRMVWVDYMVDNCSCPIGKMTACPHKMAVKMKYNLPPPPTKGRTATMDKSLASHPALKKRPRYGSKIPTTDDKHDISVHGMKKEKASDIKKFEKMVKDEFDDLAGKKTSSEEESLEVLSIKLPEQRVSEFAFECQEVQLKSLAETKTLTTDEATVMPYKAKIFSVDGNEKFAIFSPENNHAVILYKKDERKTVETPNILKLAALSTRRAATFNLHRHNKPMAAISYRLVNDNINLENAASKLHKDGISGTGSNVHIELGCYCRMPITVSDDPKNLAKCSNCSSSYHISCMDDNDKNSLENSSRKWICKPCEIPRNIVWGDQGVCVNTCTVDPMFQTVYLAIEDNPDLIKNFPQDEAHNALKEALVSIADDKCYEAHSTWYNLVHNSNPTAFKYPDSDGDCWGNINDISYTPLRNGHQFTRILTCNNEKCPAPVTIQDKTDSLYIRANEGNAKQQIEKLLADRKDVKCNKCKTGMVSGKKVEFSTNDKVWFINFIGSGHHSESDGTHKDLDLEPIIRIPDQDGKISLYSLCYL